VSVSMTTRLPGFEATTAQRRVGDAVRAVQELLEAMPGGIFKGSISDLAAAVCCDAEIVRQAVAALDRADHTISIDVNLVSEPEIFALIWAPVTGIVDLLLDWDLLTVEITIEELAHWLAVSRKVTTRALGRLGEYPGAQVGVGSVRGTVRIAIDPQVCPLTADVPALVA
jgi:hypothetical protein